MWEFIPPPSSSLGTAVGAERGEITQLIFERFGRFSRVSDDDTPVIYLHRVSAGKAKRRLTQLVPHAIKKGEGIAPIRDAPAQRVRSRCKEPPD